MLSGRAGRVTSIEPVEWTGQMIEVTSTVRAGWPADRRNHHRQIRGSTDKNSHSRVTLG
jgi:hypothetical protein